MWGVENGKENQGGEETMAQTGIDRVDAKQAGGSCFDGL